MAIEGRRGKETQTARLMVESALMAEASSSAGGTSYGVPYQGRCTDDGDFGEASVWCSPEGNWTIKCKISNHSMWCHKYKASCSIGYKEGDQLIAIAHIETNVIELCGHHAENFASSSGNSQAIKDGYGSISAAQFFWHQLE